jgi:hypothetical protein
MLINPRARNACSHASSRRWGFDRPRHGEASVWLSAEIVAKLAGTPVPELVLNIVSDKDFGEVPCPDARLRRVPRIGEFSLNEIFGFGQSGAADKEFEHLVVAVVLTKVLRPGIKRSRTASSWKTIIYQVTLRPALVGSSITTIIGTIMRA